MSTLRQIGGYRVLSRIGQGATGVVYLVEDERLGRHVALKVLAEELSASVAVRERFLQETRVAAGLDHPHIVPVYDAGEADGVLYLAMRYVEGSDLRALLRRAGPLSPERALAIAAQIARALDAAHARGLVHRDVKPGNVLIGEDEHVYLADFGISQPLDDALAAGTVLGTPAYLAPEQIEGGHVDARTDVYGLACLLYECLCGEPPFADAGSELAMLWAHLEQSPRPPSAVRAELPARLDAVLAKALAKDPRDRHETCQALTDAVRVALHEHPGDLPPMFGREQELRRLLAAWEQPGGVVLISGPRGSGKTRLAAEFARRTGAATRWLTAGDAIGSSEALVIVEDLDTAPLTLRAGTLIVGTLRDASALRPLELLDHIALGGLATADVERIVALYADDAPVEQIARAAEGLPGAVHDLAAEWARAEARRRVTRSAAQATVDRANLRDTEAALSEAVLHSQLARERARLYLPELTSGPVATIPFMGLAGYGRADADLFFGRERLVVELVAALAAHPFLAVVGPSGSGKSSLLHAGLLPALAGGVLEGSERRPQLVVRPGTLPDTTEPGSVVVVDQFEELFTDSALAGREAEIVERLLGWAADGRLVALALRADFYGRCGAFSELAAHQVLIGPMQPDELRRAIELPAARAGVTVKRDLVDALVQDVGGAPGALPLLSTALRELWEQRTGPALTLDAYTASGGVDGAVARLAESVYASLKEPNQELCRAIMLRLAAQEPDAGVVRRRVQPQQLELGRREDARAVLDVLTEKRLVSAGEHGVEVAHEALLTHWPRLRAWLDEDAEGRAVRQHLATAADEWDRGGRPVEELYRGTRLLAASEWVRAERPQINDAERAFLEHSREASERETRRIRRANRRLRALLGAAVVLIVAAVAGGAIAVEQRATAREAEVGALAQRLGAQGLVEKAPDRSLLLARQGVALDDSLQTHGNLLGALLKSPAALRVIQGSGNRLLDSAIDPGGTVVAFADNTDSVVLVDPRTYRRIGEPLKLDGQPWLLAFSPDARTLAVTLNKPGGTELVLIELPSRRIVARRALEETAFGGVRFSPDGTKLATFEVPFANGAANRVVLLDPRTARPTGPTRSFPSGSGTVAYAGADRLLVTWANLNDGDFVGKSVVVDPASLRTLRRIGRGEEVVAVSPNGRLAAVPVGLDGRAALIDLRTGAVRTLRGRHNGGVRGLAFAGDDTLVTAANDNALIVWDVRTGEPRETLVGHAGPPSNPSITPDGRTAFTGGLDRIVIAWDIAGDRRLGRRFTVEGPESPMDEALRGLRPIMSWDGRWAAIRSPDGAISVRDARTTAERGAFPPPLDGPADIAFLPDGALAFAGDGEFGVLDPISGKILKRVRIGDADGRVGALAVQPGGGIAVATGGRVARFDVDTMRQARKGFALADVAAIALSPDGTGVAAAQADGRLAVWDASGKLRRVPTGLITGRALAYSPDGRMLATGNDAGYARLWDSTTLKPLGPTVLTHAGFVLDIGFSPDGRLLFTGGSDSVAALWAVPALKPVGTPLPVGQGGVFARFTVDGSRLFTVAEAGDGAVWEIRPDAWKRRACAVAGRTLTEREWSDVLPERPYRPTC